MFDYEEMKRYVELIHPNCGLQGKIELRLFQNNIPQPRFFNTCDIDNLVSYIQANNGKKDCFMGIALRKDSTSGEKHNCSYLNAIYIDVDCGKVGHKKPNIFPDTKSALELIERLDLGESMRVNTGHGVHLYWIFSKPLELNKENIQKAENLMKRISTSLHGDATWDVSRVLRIPQTLNLKAKDDVVLSSILYSNDDRKYDLDELIEFFDNHPFFSVNIARLNRNNMPVEAKLLYQSILGYETLGKDDRSARDQKMFCDLLKYGYSKEEIITIFQYFPTSGHTLDKTKYPSFSDAIPYLNHSIDKAIEYNKNSPKSEKNINTSVTKNKPSSTDNMDEDDNSIYEVIDITGTGYYKRYNDKTIRISNCVISFDKVISKINSIGETIKSEIYGKVKMDNGFSQDIHFPTNLLTGKKELYEYLLDVVRPDIEIEDIKYFAKAIRQLNTNYSQITQKLHGYNADLTEYHTKNMTITATELRLTDNYLLNEDNWKLLKPSFQFKERNDIKSLLCDFINWMNNWGSNSLTQFCAAFAIAPLTDPFMKSKIEQKPYLMLTGTSGNGKTITARLIQRLYGQCDTLESWTSTANGISIMAHSYKDMLFCVDDLKIQHSSQHDMTKTIRFFQTYSDRTSRTRATSNMERQEDFAPECFVLSTSEDIPFSELSTIARGVFIKFDKLGKSDDEMEKAKNLSKCFSKITPHIIQYILQNREHINSLINSAIQKVEEILSPAVDKVATNKFRLEDNFKVLLFNLLVLNSFFEAMGAPRQNMETTLNDLKKLFIENFERIKDHTIPEIIQENFNYLLDAEMIYLKQINTNDCEFINDKSKIVGEYHKEGDEVKIWVKIPSLVKAINQMFPGTVTVSTATIISELEKAQLLLHNKSGVTTFNKKSIRGYEWLGRIPIDIKRNVFKLKIPITLEEKLLKYSLKPSDLEDYLDVDESKVVNMTDEEFHMEIIHYYDMCKEYADSVDTDESVDPDPYDESDYVGQNEKTEEEFSY